MVIFDTLRTTQRLREAGFEPDQAEALVAALSDGARDDLATKPDIDRLEARIDRVGERLDGVEARLDRVEARMDRLENKLDETAKQLDAKIERLDDKIDETAQQLNGKIDQAVRDLDAKIERLGSRMVWLVGGALGLLATLLTIATGVIIAFG